jgi:hypothetical protein
LKLPTSELLGPTTYHCGKLDGGVAYNVVAAEAYALCGIRVTANLLAIERQVTDVVGKYPDVELKKSLAYPETVLDHEFEGEMQLFLPSSQEYRQFFDDAFLEVF